MSSNSKKSIKKNYFYNLSYQILLLITPLITTPYLSRVLGADGIGTVSFSESVVSYFVLFATLGMTTFGQREVSYVQDDINKRTIVFWETKILEIITSLIVLIFYIPFALFSSNRIMYLILGFNILSVMANVTWFFQGLEEFRIIVIRNFIIKILSIIYIFLFVKDEGDVNTYVFGLAFFLLVSNISLWSKLPKYIVKLELKSIKPLKNIKTIISLFIPTIAIQVYTVLDKTMIGLITGDSTENGYYEQAIKISKIVLTIVTALGTVMIPRIGYYHAKGDVERVRYFMYRGYRFVWFLGVPLCFGLVGVSSNFVPWFFGDGYLKVIPLLSILGFLILAIGINNVTGMQYLIPTKRQNIFTMTVLAGALVNFVLNLILIFPFKSIGAAIASVSAETVIAIVQLIIVKNEFSVKKVVVSSLHYFFAGIIMLIILLFIGSFLKSSVINTVFLVAIGLIVYIGILIVIRDDFLIDNFKSVIIRIKKKQ